MFTIRALVVIWACTVYHIAWCYYSVIFVYDTMWIVGNKIAHRVYKRSVMLSPLRGVWILFLELRVIKITHKTVVTVNHWDGFSSWHTFIEKNQIPRQNSPDQNSYLRTTMYNGCHNSWLRIILIHSRTLTWSTPWRKWALLSIYFKGQRYCKAVSETIYMVPEVHFD